ncbi:hypothetical protein SEET0012_17099 [Salmonella enterica subsp. enterica serovar Tallahassee str. 0012]|nr:hypothetical protein SEET0012_17099 [Salmonella enterica subsp. enterica serovar Tallahassee str. 0012]
MVLVNLNYQAIIYGITAMILLRFAVLVLFMVLALNSPFIKGLPLLLV